MARVRETSVEVICSVTQNLSDGLRAIVMSSVGRRCHVSRCAAVAHECVLSSWCHVLFVPHTNGDDAGNCSPCLSGCCEHIFTLLRQIFMCLQVFYGRYLKKLSNQTQEAMGEMTKVNLSLSFSSFAQVF